jgi:2Fe-2S ferredoxin
LARVTFIAFDGSEMLIDAASGLSLMENAIANGVEGIEAQCGGNAYCATCRVIPQGMWSERLGARGDIEEGLLSSLDVDNPEVRLSCQITVSETLDGLVVRVPESQS